MYTKTASARSIGRMMLLECVYNEPGPNNTVKETKFLKAMEKDSIQYIDTYVCPTTGKIVTDRSVVVERNGKAHITWHPVEEVVYALAGQERSEVGFKTNPHPYGSYV